jgi:hypothetical protein
MTTTERPAKAAIDLLDTSACAVRLACESCCTRADLSVATCNTPLGVLCVTLCRRCRESGKRPRWSGTRGADRINQHCHHLGIERATMSAVLGQQKSLELPEVWFS